MLGEPARRFRYFAADPPDEKSADHRHQHHNAPARDAKWMERHELPGEERPDGRCKERDRLTDGEGPAAQRLRHKFAHIGVDGDEFDAHPDTGDEAPQIDAEARTLEGHNGGCGGVPQKREREDVTPPIFVGNPAEQDGSDE